MITSTNIVINLEINDRRNNNSHNEGSSYMMNHKNQMEEIQFKLEKEEEESSKLLSQVTDLQSKLKAKEEKRTELQLKVTDQQSQLTVDIEEEFIIELESQIDQLQSKFNEKERETSILQSQLTDFKIEQHQQEQQELSNNENSETNDDDTTSSTITTGASNSNRTEERETTIQLRAEIIQLQSKVQELTTSLKSRDEETTILRRSLSKEILDTKEYMNKVKDLEEKQYTLQDQSSRRNSTLLPQQQQKQQYEKQNRLHIIRGYDEEVPTAIEDHCMNYTTVTTGQTQQEESLERYKAKLSGAQVVLTAGRKVLSVEVIKHKAVREKLTKVENKLRLYKIAGSRERLRLLKENLDLKIMIDRLSMEKNDVINYLLAEQQKQLQQKSCGSSSGRNCIWLKRGQRGIGRLKRKSKKVGKSGEYSSINNSKKNTIPSTLSISSESSASKSSSVSIGRISRMWI